MALTLFVAAAGAPKGWKWDKGVAKADDGVPAQCDSAVATCDTPPADPAPCDPAVATCDDPANGDPDGWSWNSLPDGWSWNEAEIVSLGNQVTLAADGSKVAVAAPDGVAPSVGDTVAVVDTGDDTLLGFRTDEGEIEWTTLGWSWND